MSAIPNEIYDELIPLIDQEKCCGDELCVNACVRRCLSMNSEKKAQYKPRMTKCFQCGHCVAICPKGAVSFENLPLEDLEVEKNLTDTTSLANLIKMRRSIRNFKDTLVPEEDLVDALNIATYAPTGKNLQDVSWVIISDANIIEKLTELTIEAFGKTGEEQAIMAGKAMQSALKKGRNRITYNAKQMIFAYAPKESSHHMVNTTIAMSYLELILSTKGIGTCWAGYVSSASEIMPEMNELLGIPENSCLDACLLVGYPKAKYRRSALRKALRVKTI